MLPLLALLPAAMGAAGGISGIINSSQDRRRANNQMASARDHASGDRNAAFNLLEQIPGQAHQAYDPYIQSGQRQQGLANEQFNKMSANPTSYLDSLISGYRPSTGYEFKEKRALEAARNSAAQGGFSGTRFDQGQQAEMVNGLLGADMQQFLQNVLGIQGTGLAGQTHQGDIGFQASRDLENSINSNLSERAGLRNGQAMANDQRADQYGRNAYDAHQGLQKGIGGLMSSIGGLGGSSGNLADMANMQRAAQQGDYYGNYGAPRSYGGYNNGRGGVVNGVVPGRVPQGIQSQWPFGRGG